jgi:SAM-dependent methyltransferase
MRDLFRAIPFKRRGRGNIDQIKSRLLMKNFEGHFAANKQSWNKRTGIHKGSAFYDLDNFKKGRSSLNSIELEGMGDVSGKTLLHLQCHFGMDTMSWQRLGAQCTGIDISDEAIKLAKEIAAELDLPSRFICCNVYDTAQHVDEPFDIVFTSYGTIGWLPDLQAWAKMISDVLRPGGIFYIADFHPVLWMMDEKFEHIKYDYFNTGVIAEETSGTYTDRDAPIRSKEYSWNHPFSEIFSALIENGLRVTAFNEYSFSPYNCFNNLEQGIDGMWRIKGMDEKMPMMYSIKAIKYEN